MTIFMSWCLAKHKDRFTFSSSHFLVYFCTIVKYNLRIKVKYQHYAIRLCYFKSYSANYHFYIFKFPYEVKWAPLCTAVTVWPNLPALDDDDDDDGCGAIDGM
jgi:hypothetical protein